MTESEQLILTLRESRHETTERIALDPARYPALQRVLLGPDGETIRHEMEALLIRFRRPRAQRHQVRMLATLVVPEDHREREEAAEAALQLSPAVPPGRQPRTTRSVELRGS
jgi:hypothetical protein